MPDLLLEYGLDDRVSTLFSSLTFPTQQRDETLLLGRVIRVERTNCLVATSAGVVRAGVATSPAPLPPAPATGDWVGILSAQGADPVIATVLPRSSELSRRAPEDRGGHEQVLAANIDVLALTVPVDRPSSMSRLERMLVLAWDSGARPLVVLTKADLRSDPAEIEYLTAEAGHAALGVDVLLTSGETGRGVPALRTAVGGGTLAFIGPSGAGKSTLVNALLGSEAQKTGAVRAADSRGRHTTTSRDLIPLPGGGVLLDTPGLRSLGLLDVDGAVASTFADIEELARACQFNDCRHGVEPGCAVREAIRAGQLSARRLDNYGKMLREIAHERRRQVGAQAYAARRQFRAMHANMLRNAGPARMDARRQKRR